MRSRLSMVMLFTVGIGGVAHGADTASGSFSAAPMAPGARVDTRASTTISPKFATAYLVRDQRNARNTQVEVLLTEVAIDPAPIRAALSPRMTAINADGLQGRPYISIWINPDGTISMNATLATMTQYLNDSAGGLKTEWRTRTASRIEGRVFTDGPLKTSGNTTYTVDLTFAVDAPAAVASQPLPSGGGDPGKALIAFIAAVNRKDWNAIKAASGPDALKMFDKSYNTPAENADGAKDLVNAWISINGMKITRGQLIGDAAILDVEGVMNPGMISLTVVRMVRSGTVWQFDQAVRAGFVK
jgi:hypothetical protein